jgi:hypothetical protein
MVVAKHVRRLPVALAARLLTILLLVLLLLILILLLLLFLLLVLHCQVPLLAALVEEAQGLSQGA